MKSQWQELLAFVLHRRLARSKMPPVRTTAIAIEERQPQATGVIKASSTFFTQVGDWAGDTAQEFGSFVAALMGPAVFSVYAIAAWSLAADLGWTQSFLFTSGPLSNWLVWLIAALLVNVAATILRRHTDLPSKS